MALEEIYATFSTGSEGFIRAVETHCGFGISRDEIERIAEDAESPVEFELIYTNEDYWTDDKNS